MEQRVGELAACQQALAIRRRLARIDPSNAQWRHDEACVLDRIGNAYRKTGKTQEAIAAYEQGVAVWRQLAKHAPRDLHRQLKVSMSLKQLGDVKLDAADQKGAIASYEEGVVFWRRILKREPDSTRWLSNMAESLERIGDLKLEAGDNKGALTNYEEMLSIDRQLVTIEDTNTEWQWNFSLSLDRIGEVNLILGNVDAAGAAYDESLAIRRRLVELDQSNARWQHGVSLVQKRTVELKRVVEAKALAEDSMPRVDLLSGAANVGQPQEQLSRAGKIRKVRDVFMSKMRIAYEVSLAIVRNPTQQSAMLGVGEVFHKLSLWFSELNSRVIIPLRRYRRRGEAFAESFSPKIRAGVQGFEHVTKAVRLELKRLLSEWSPTRIAVNSFPGLPSGSATINPPICVNSDLSQCDRPANDDGWSRRAKGISKK
jgi:tetratricopeptide (TPR) repeat protein